MGSDHVIRGGGAEFYRGQSGGGGDEAVHNNGFAVGGGGEIHADETGDIETADFGNDVDGIVFIGFVDFQRAVQHFFFMLMGFVGETGAFAYGLIHGHIGESHENTGAGAGVGHTEFTGTDDIVAFFHHFVGDFNTDFHGFHAVFAAHGGAFGEVGGAFGHFAVDHAGNHIVAVDTDIDENIFGVGFFGENGHAAAAGGHGMSHQRGHFLRRHGNAFGMDAVIGAHRDDAAFFHFVAFDFTGDAGDLGGDGFQLAEAADGFDQTVNIGHGFFLYFFVQGPDGVHCFFQ